MKTYILSILVLLAATAAWGETGCRMIEHVDHNEAICIGDEKTVREQLPQAQGKREPVMKTAPITGPSQQAVPVTADITPSVPAANQTAGTPTPVQNAAPTTRVTSETAAEHLARRKALAIKATEKNRVNTAPAPAAQ